MWIRWSMRDYLLILVASIAEESINWYVIRRFFPKNVTRWRRLAVGFAIHFGFNLLLYPMVYRKYTAKYLTKYQARKQSTGANAVPMAGGSE